MKVASEYVFVHGNTALSRGRRFLKLPTVRSFFVYQTFAKSAGDEYCTCCERKKVPILFHDSENINRRLISKLCLSKGTEISDTYARGYLKYESVR
jgi:hypothetical protein